MMQLGGGPYHIKARSSSLLRLSQRFRPSVAIQEIVDDAYCTATSCGHAIVARGGSATAHAGGPPTVALN